jgi:hypothetical protein
MLYAAKGKKHQSVLLNTWILKIKFCLVKMILFSKEKLSSRKLRELCVCIHAFVCAGTQAHEHKHPYMHMNIS